MDQNINTKIENKIILLKIIQLREILNNPY